MRDLLKHVLLWGSPARQDRTGKQWRVIVYQRGFDPDCATFGPYVGYEWRPYPSADWRPETDWPGYDHNDGQTAGLPDVTQEIYKANRETLDLMLSAKRDKRRPSTEPTPAGLQYVMPGCEKDQKRGPVKMSLF
jgi:hypothetical protein